MELYFTLKKNELMTFSGKKWMEQEKLCKGKKHRLGKR